MDTASTGMVDAHTSALDLDRFSTDNVVLDDRNCLDNAVSGFGSGSGVVVHGLDLALKWSCIWFCKVQHAAN